MRKIFLYCLLSAAMLITKNVKSQDSSTIQGFLQYVMQPLDKNQIGNGYLEEYGFPAISMATYNGTLSTNNKFALSSSKTTGPLTVFKTLKTINKNTRIIYNKHLVKRYRKVQRLLAICLQSNITKAAFSKHKTAKNIKVNTHAFNGWLPPYLSLFALFRI